MRPRQRSAPNDGANCLPPSRPSCERISALLVAGPPALSGHSIETPQATLPAPPRRSLHLARRLSKAPGQCIRRPAECARSPVRSGTRHDPVHPTIQGQNVELALRILPKRADRAAGRQELRPIEPRGHIAATVAEAQYKAVAIVGVEIMPDERRHLRAAVDVAAGDGAGADRVGVFDDRQYEARHGAAADLIAGLYFHCT